MKLKLLAALSPLLLALASMVANAGQTGSDDPPEVAIGERLFLETRFARAYFDHPGKPDPALAHTLTTKGRLPGPFAGQTINCRACHLVDEHQKTRGAGMRSYADFARRSPVPARGDGQTHTARNSMAMVNISLPGPHGELFHFDGEFNSMEDLVRATFTGRNFGWKPGEEPAAVAHIARIVRTDDGRGALAREFGGSYRRVLAGKDRDLPEKFRLPPRLRLDVDKASDREIVRRVSELVAIYVRQLAYSRDKQERYNGSPYDHFLKANALPAQPAPEESPSAYRERLRRALAALKNPRFLTARNGKFTHHRQDFTFGPKELAGLKLFLDAGTEQRRGGNCAACHAPPDFSDFRFHNTGLSQLNYDRAHGAGAFARIEIPPLAVRNRAAREFLPPASERLRSPADRSKPGHTDLGLWNVFANPAMPAPQTKLRRHLCNEAGFRKIGRCDDNTLLPLSIAAFKTPVLRNLGHSNPYMHTGQFDSLNEVVTFYVTVGPLARQGQLRNGDPRLVHIHLEGGDIEALVAFLRALNEDYE
jgi:cytochrome c peroxidase